MNTTTRPAPQSPDQPALPPGPASMLDGIKWMRDSARDYVGSMRDLKQRFGDITLLRVFHERICILQSPEVIRTVLVDHASSLTRQERLLDIMRQAHGNSIMVSEGEDWQRQHSLLRPGFSPKHVSGYAQLMVDAMRSALDQLAKQSQAPHSAPLIDVTRLMHGLTMDVILRALFGQAAGHERDTMIGAIQTLDEVFMHELYWPVTLPDWLPLPGKRRKREALHALNDLIRQRISGSAQCDQDGILSMLMNARSEDGREALSPQEIHDQCKVVFLAGQETSAVALTWWSWLMASHPAQAQRAKSEIDAVVGQRDPTPDDLSKMPWLMATLKESMRLFPPAPGLLTRRTHAQIQVGPYAIPSNCMVIPVIWSVHHDERWFASPEAFQPERFMPDAPALSRGSWMPFGVGPRVCIGQHFAMLEMGLMATMLLQRFSLDTDPNQAPPKAEMQLTLRPAGPLYLRFTSLRSASASQRT